MNGYIYVQVHKCTSTTSNDVRRSPRTRSVDSRHPAPVSDVAADVPPRSRTSYSSRGVRFANLIPVSVQASTATSSPPTQSKIIKILYFNSQSCRQKASDIHEMIFDDGIDILLMTETWLYAQGDEACIAEMTPRGYMLRSFPRTGSRGGGIASIVRNAFCDSTSFKPLSFQSFEAVELHISDRDLSVSVVCLYSAPNPPPPPPPPPQQEEQTLQSVVSPRVPRVSHTVCRFPQ